MPTTIDFDNLDQVTFNGTDVTRVFSGGVKVWNKMKSTSVVTSRSTSRSTTTSWTTSWTTSRSTSKSTTTSWTTTYNTSKTTSHGTSRSTTTSWVTSYNTSRSTSKSTTTSWTTSYTTSWLTSRSTSQTTSYTTSYTTSWTTAVDITLGTYNSNSNYTYHQYTGTQANTIGTISVPSTMTLDYMYIKRTTMYPWGSSTDGVFSNPYGNYSNAYVDYIRVGGVTVSNGNFYSFSNSGDGTYVDTNSTITAGNKSVVFYVTAGNEAVVFISLAHIKFHFV